jgi:ribosomal protein L7/L12
MGMVFELRGFRLEAPDDMSDDAVLTLVRSALQARLVSTASDKLNQTELACVRSGHHIEAIKQLRNRTGMGLAESKRVCDAARDAMKGGE